MHICRDSGHSAYKAKNSGLKDLIRLIQGKSGIKVLEKIIKSTFDADKIEYLLRDSKMTGREYINCCIPPIQRTKKISAF